MKITVSNNMETQDLSLLIHFIVGEGRINFAKSCLIHGLAFKF